MFAGWDKQLADVRAKKAKAQALLQNLDAPRIAYEALQRQEAELEAQRQAAQAEAEQLTAERASVLQDIARLDAAMANAPLVMASLDKMITACEGGLVGVAQPVARTRALYAKAIDDLAAFRQRLAGIEKRLKELDQ